MHRRFLLGASAAAAVGMASSVAASEAQAWATRRRFTPTPFGRIASVERGAGPAALFIHAWPLNGYEWRASLERLAPHRHCIAVDSMGLGYTEAREDQAITPQSQADMLAAFLEVRGIRHVDVVANDSGGAVAQLFAARHPERLRTLLLTNCDVADDNPPPAFQPLVKMAKSDVLVDKFVMPQLADLKLAQSQRGLGLAYAYPERMTHETLDIYLKPLISSPLRRRQYNAYTISLGDNVLNAIEPQLREVKAPVRIVWGTADGFFSAKSPDILDKLFPNSRGVRRVPQGKLFFPEEFPDVIAEEARRLWA